MKDKDLLKLLLKDGWELVSIRGSHHKLAKGGKTVSVLVHGKDVKKGLLGATEINFARGLFKKLLLW